MAGVDPATPTGTRCRPLVRAAAGASGDPRVEPADDGVGVPRMAVGVSRMTVWGGARMAVWGSRGWRWGSAGDARATSTARKPRRRTTRADEPQATRVSVAPTRAGMAGNSTTDTRGIQRVLTRRLLLAASPATVLALSHAQAAESFQAFLSGVRAEARRAGIAQAVLDSAFAGVSPNQKVLERDRKQPEFTMTWARYRTLLLTDKRITSGRAAVEENRSLLGRVQERYGVAPGVITGIWGLESSFGTTTGDFRVVEALATLAWEGRRASFFRGELMAALKILNAGDVSPARMTGSYAATSATPSTSRATAGGTSGPAARTCSDRSPTTSRGRAGVPGRAGASRSPCRPASTRNGRDAT